MGAVGCQITLANADFKEQQRELCMTKANEARERKEQGNQELDKLGLPAAVEARGSATGLPDTLWHRIRCVQAAVSAVVPADHKQFQRRA